MAYLIDGYNLLFVAGIPGRGVNIPALARSRLGLLQFLVESLDPRELAQTTVVFDARDAPPGLPRTLEFHGVTVRFAPRQETADQLIADLIEACRAPRELTVVSSDHQVQRAARRRRARAVDSDVWHDEVLHLRDERRRPQPAPPTAPETPLLPGDVALWLARFGGEEAVEEVLREERSKGSSPPDTSTEAKGKRDPGRRRVPPELTSDKDNISFENPFPPGYAEDLE
jgi:uncharacterized protein